MSAWAGCYETHVSAVYLLGDKALKIKKPVRTDFLDFSTVAAREAACLDEVRLNRRLSPDVYLGVSHIDLGGGQPEPAVVMRRLADGDRLSERLLSDPRQLRDQIRATARLLASFHERCEAATGEESPGAWHRLAARWQREWDELARLDSRLVCTARGGVGRSLGLRYLVGRRALIERRVAEGRVREGHGDLRAEHVYFTPDGIRVLDCVEFDERLRTTDVLSDIAFLAMDLEHRGAARAANDLLADYAEFSGDVYPDSLRHFFTAQRALVRAKVALLRARQNGDRAGESTALLHLAESHLLAALPQLICVGGLPGSGKSTLAAALATSRGAVYLSSDEIRHGLAVGETDRGPEGWEAGRYSLHDTEAVYAELLRRAEIAIADGYSVVLDASWRDAAQRERARQLACHLGASAVEIRCEIDQLTARKRLAARREGFSEAGVAVRDSMRTAFDTWPESRLIITDRDVETCCGLAIGVVNEVTGRLLDRFSRHVVREDGGLSTPLEPELCQHV